MPGCCGPDDDGRYSEVFDQRFASGLARRYRRRGLAEPGRRIVELLSELGLEGASVLEIGGGVGEIQLDLLARGASETVNLELSDAYEDEADELMRRAGIGGRVTRIVGVDLARSGPEIGPADYVVLHRVVCCYPDFEGLLGAAADHARKALVFSYPPRTWITRASVRIGNAWVALLGRRYRGYVHSPDEMLAVVRTHGLTLRSHERSRRWRIAVAVREPAAIPATTRLE